MKGSHDLMRRRSTHSALATMYVLLMNALILSTCTDVNSIAAPSKLEPEPGSSPLAIPIPTEEPVDPIGPAPLTEATPAIIIEPSEQAASPTIGPPPFGVPMEELVFFAPGPGSFAANAVRVDGYGGPSLNNRVQLCLYGEDGRKLSEGYAWLYSYPGTPGVFYATMPYDLPLVAEMGWLQVRSFGDRYGNLKHANTISLTLLSEGSEKIYPALHGAEQLAIFAPREDGIVDGGTVRVRGAGWVDHDGPIIIQILDRSGNLLGSTETEIDSPAPGHVGAFSIDIEYQIAYPQWVRISVTEPHPVIDAPSHYTSVEVWLRP